MPVYQRIVDDIKANRNQRFLFFILLVAALLRIPLLSTIPNGFHADEASIGYDAYSILKTGRDQYGEFLPLFARSFGDYDEALYRFITVPFVQVFGLTEFATRLPAAFIGILTVWVFYSVVREYFDERVALVAALLLAISPWHIHFSRWAVRAILLPFFFCVGLFFFRKGLRRRPWYMLLSSVAFGVCLHTYNSARVFVPLFMLGLILIYRRELWRIRRQTLVSGVLFFAIFVPLFMFWISPEGMARAEEKLVTDPFSILSNYVSYLNPKFLFFYGDNNIRHRLQNMGQLYHFELVTVLAGVWGLFKERRRAHRILSLWLILYPIPAALTEQTHAIRSIMGAPLFAILSAYGFFTVAGYFKSSKVKTGFFLGSTLVVACSLVVFCKFYFLEYPKYGANAWRHGMKEVIAFIEKSPYQKVVMSDRYFFFPPYIYILFYTKYDPEKYQRHPLQLRQKLWKDTEEPLGKYHTQSISRIKVEGTVLLCIRPDEIVEVIKKGYDWREVHTVRAPNGWDLISLVKVTGGK